MWKTIVTISAIAVAGLAPQFASAGGVKAPQLKAPQAAIQLAQSVRVMPPASHSSQWWTNASGCEYSRTGRPGEVVWFLTGVKAGVSCPEFIVQNSGYDYRKPYMVQG